MGHTKKDCLERPRKIAAKYMNKQLAADDFVQPTLVQTYDGKRDRWAGYDPSQHKAIVEQYQRIEEAKRALKAEKLNKTDNEVSITAICFGTVCEFHSDIKYVVDLFVIAFLVFFILIAHQSVHRQIILHRT